MVDKHYEAPHEIYYLLKMVICESWSLQCIKITYKDVVYGRKTTVFDKSILWPTDDRIGVNKQYTFNNMNCV